MPARRSGAVVSDLHLFARRSRGDRLFAEFEAEAGDIDSLVLNGDTFDFRWSQLPSESATVDAALEWLTSLLERQPRWDVHFVLGNHDCVISFHEGLERLAGDHPRLHCHEHRLRLGELLFLHGDCANQKMDARKLARFRKSWSRDHQRGPTAARLYDVADALGLSHRFHDLYFRQAITTARVAHHLDQVTPGWTEEIRHCYFGHTHRPFRDLVHRGVLFSNTGSAIRNMGFQPLRFEWSLSSPRQSALRP
ncbi:hypothetical protein Hhel01_04244 [Haloferula helveola]